MTIRLTIHYKTTFGEQLVVVFANTDVSNYTPDAASAENSDSTPEPGSGNTRRVPMHTADGDTWTCCIDRDSLPDGFQSEYYYAVCRNGIDVRSERVRCRRSMLHLQHAQGSVAIYDSWIDAPALAVPVDLFLRKSAAHSSIGTKPADATEATVGTDSAVNSGCMRFQMRTDALLADEHPAVVGSCKALGLWRADKSLPMQIADSGLWIVDIHIDSLPLQFEFKFVVLRKDSPKDIVWETGYNRTVDISSAAAVDTVVVDGGVSHFCKSRPRYAGTLVPLFSLRSEGSFGIGDFGDLRLMADWLALSGQHVLQLLPVNDTTLTHTWRDSYPYSPVSVFALHPQYVDLRQLPKLSDRRQQSRFESLRKQLNALPAVDYERVNEAKEDYLTQLYAQEGRQVLRRVDVKRFIDAHRYWLEPYAAYCSRRDGRKHPKSYYYYVQYILHAQMSAAHAYANARGIMLKGDIPIGVSRDGCDVWKHPEYFNTDYQTGAPPDDFACEGQNWGFPTYNWDTMLADGCLWWRQRLAHMSLFFDAYRIDHVLGFFRIWEIPVSEASGLKGQFAPALAFTAAEAARRGCNVGETQLFQADHRNAALFHPNIYGRQTKAYADLTAGQKAAYDSLSDDFFYHRNTFFWRNEAMRKLPAIVDSTDMLPCAEDLGMVPECVTQVLDELGILSLEVEFMPKTSGRQFADVSAYPYRSVAIISSHDMPTLREWWDEDHSRSQQYYGQVLRHSGTAPHPLPSDVAAEIVSRQLLSPSALCILALQDWLAVDSSLRRTDVKAERVNVPANPDNYWQYRMHITIEQLLRARQLNGKIKSMIAKRPHTEY